MVLRSLLLFLGLVVAVPAAGQVSVSGLVVDSVRKPVAGARVVLTRTTDSLVTGAISNQQGQYQIQAVPPGSYRLRITAPGFRQYQQAVAVGSQALTLPAVQLRDLVLAEVDIVDQIPIAQQKGDTTEFNAQAFKVNRDASAEDLLRKMPGVTIQNGQVQAQGETVQRVLVDGRPMFDNDPSAALRNLPAETVDRVQVYDDVSDAARFSGFNDGQTRRTINIITRPDRRKAEFGRLFGGYGTDERYQAGATLNRFRGPNRLTILAQTNNTNQQNFAFEDLFSGFGGGGGGGLRGGAAVFRIGGGGGGQPQFFGGGGGGGAIGNLFVGGAQGIVETNALAINFSDDLGKRAKFSGSYLLNDRRFSNLQDLNRIFASQEALSQTYVERGLSANRNLTHRWTGRLEWDLDTANQIVINTRGTYQAGDVSNGYQGQTRINDSLYSEVRNAFGTDNSGITFNLEALYRHRFRKAGRTITIGGTVDLNDREEDRLTEADNFNFFPIESAQLLRQQARTEQQNWTYSGNVSITEGLTKNSQAELTYNITRRDNESDARTFDNDPGSADFRELDTLLSNVFESASLNQQAGVGYRFANPKHNLTARLLYSWTTLDNDQTFPQPDQLSQRFTNLLPSITYQYTISRMQSLRINYRTQANLPQVSQLQDVVDVSNPQRPSTGNPNLRQEFQHVLFANWRKADPARSTFRVVNLFATYTQDNIATVTDILRTPLVLENGILIPAGAQFTQPQNLGEALNVRLFGLYAFPIKSIKSNFNGNLSATYTSSPGRVNGQNNTARNAAVNGGLSLTSNISENLDFTVSSNTSYNVVNNSLAGQNDNYWNQRSSVRLDWRLGRNKGWLIQTDAENQVVTGLSEGFNTNFTLWNLAVGHKLFKSQAGEIKLYVFDVLKQNNSLTRNVTNTYFEDVRNTVIQQYAMLIFTYNFRKFRA